jgi:chromosome partitioning protein
MEMMCFVNQKGGTGKTTSAVNVAAILAKRGKKTLLVDLDPQSNATMSLMDPLEVDVKKNIATLLMGDATVDEVVCKLKHLENLCLIPATLDLSITELELTRLPTGGVLLEKRLKKEKDYDYIICDCPPNFGVLTANALYASSHMIVTMEPETFSFYGLQMLISNIVPRIGKLINPDIKLLGILLLRVNPIRTLTANLRLEIRRLYQNLLFDTEIPIDVRLPESQAAHQPIILYARTSRAATAYEELTNEIADRLGES